MCERIECANVSNVQNVSNVRTGTPVPQDVFVGLHLLQALCEVAHDRRLSHTNIKDWVHDRLYHTNIKDGVHDRLSHTNIKDWVHDRLSYTNIKDP